MRNLAVGGLIVAIVASVFALDARDPANAAAWCAAYHNGSSNCGFSTFEQCLAAVRGEGGSCNRNSAESDAEKPAARKQREAEPKPKRKEAEPKRKEKEKEKERAAPAQKSAPAPVAVQPPAVAQPVPPPVAVQPPSPAVARQPGPAQPRAAAFQAATALILAGKYQDGIAAMKSLGYDNHPDVASLIGFANSKLGQLSEAQVWYNRALAADPNHLVTWGYSGILHVVQGDTAKARAALARIKVICGSAACPEYQALDGVIAGKRR